MHQIVILQLLPQELLHERNKDQIHLLNAFTQAISNRHTDIPPCVGFETIQFMHVHRPGHVFKTS